MRHRHTFVFLALAFVSSTVVAADESSDWKPLLDPKLSMFDVYLSYRGDQIMSGCRARLLRP